MSTAALAPRERDLGLMAAVAVVALGLGLFGNLWIAALLIVGTWIALRRWRPDARGVLALFAGAYAVGVLLMLILSTPVSGTSSNGGVVEAIPVQSDRR